MKVFDRILWLGILNSNVPGSFRSLAKFETLKDLVEYAEGTEHLYLPYTNLSVALSRNYVPGNKLSLVYSNREQGFCIWAENTKS